MIVTPPVTYGLDSKIARLQTAIDNRLTWADPVIYGRVHRMVKGERTIPEVYDSEGEYKPIFFDDTTSANVGFYVTDREVSPLSAMVDIIFTGNLDEIYGPESYRLDEKAMIEAKRVLEAIGLEVQDIKTGAEVFADFTTVNHKDMHPYFSFSYTCRIDYIDDFCS